MEQVLPTGSLEDSNPANFLILHFWLLGLWDNKYLLFKSPNLWFFIMAALENWYSV